MKNYGPNKESLLMTLCCHKDDAPALRAQIFALISTVLKDSNEEAIAMIIRKNECGLSALGKVYLGSIWVHTGPSGSIMVHPSSS